MSYATPRAMLPGNLSAPELTQVYFNLTVAPAVEFKGPLAMTVDVPGLDESRTVTFSGSTLAGFTLDAPDADFTTGNWTITVAKTAIPDELKDPETGFLAPDKLLNIGQVMVFDAAVNWGK